MTTSVKVEGDDQLARTLKAAADDLEDLGDVNADAARYLATRAAAAAPRVSGALAGSVRPVADKTTATVTAGGPGVPYANPIHWGWPARNISPQPFLVDTMANSQAAVVELYQANNERILSTVKGI